MVDFYDAGGDAAGVGRPSHAGRVRPLDLSVVNKADLIAFLGSLSATVGP